MSSLAIKAMAESHGLVVVRLNDELEAQRTEVQTLNTILSSIGQTLGCKEGESIVEKLQSTLQLLSDKDKLLNELNERISKLEQSLPQPV